MDVPRLCAAREINLDAHEIRDDLTEPLSTRGGVDEDWLTVITTRW
jgi:hypothetical protein